MHLVMEIMQFWLQQESAHKRDRQQTYKQIDSELGPVPAEIQLLRSQMQQSDDAADDAEMKITLQNDVRDRSGKEWKVVFPEKRSHIAGKNRPASAE